MKHWRTRGGGSQCLVYFFLDASSVAHNLTTIRNPARRGTLLLNKSNGSLGKNRTELKTVFWNIPRMIRATVIAVATNKDKSCNEAQKRKFKVECVFHRNLSEKVPFK